MIEKIDEFDRRLLDVLQRDATDSLDALGERIGLSRNATWRRLKSLEDAGIIKGRVVLVDPLKIGLRLAVFIQIRTNSHEPNWLENFARATRDMPEVLAVYRMSGDLDYLVHARVADMAAYDELYQQLIRKVEMSDVSASFVMEEIKSTTALPLYAS